MKIIVNADDMGYTRGVSEGIIEGYEKGIVTSTTVMCNMDQAAQAAQRPRRLYLVVRPRRLRHNLHGLGAVLYLRGKPHTPWCDRQGAAKMA